MNITESLHTGFLEIRSHKMRSFLSFSAISFGIAAILYTFAQVHQMYTQQSKAFELAGPGRLEIEQNWREGKKGKGLSKGLTLEDARTLRTAMPWLYMVNPLVQGWASFQYRNFQDDDINIYGITTEWRKRNWVYTLSGRLFNEQDIKSAARVCLVNVPGGWVKKPFWLSWYSHGSEKETFFQRHNLLGQSIRLKDHLFTVVGVLQNPPHDKDPRWFDRMGWSASILVPITTYHTYMARAGRNSSGASDLIDEIQVDTGAEQTVPMAKRQIEAMLNIRHRGEDDYKIRDFREVIQNRLNETRKYAMAVLAIGIVSILAGGIGIMNVTLATIFSRIREIGIRRAIGATQGDILIQFVTEAMMLGFCGGIAGIALGLTGIVYLTGGSENNPIESLRTWHVFATLLIAIGAGFVFSLYPAYKASQLDPVEALRYE